METDAVLVVGDHCRGAVQPLLAGLAGFGMQRGANGVGVVGLFLAIGLSLLRNVVLTVRADVDDDVNAGVECGDPSVTVVLGQQRARFVCHE